MEKFPNPWKTKKKKRHLEQLFAQKDKRSWEDGIMKLPGKWQKVAEQADSLEKMLILGRIESKRRRGQQRMRCWMASLTQWT